MPPSAIRSRSVLCVAIAISSFCAARSEAAEVATSHGTMVCELQVQNRAGEARLKWQSQTQRKAILTSALLFQGQRGGTSDVRVFPRGTTVAPSAQLRQSIDLTTTDWYDVAGMTVSFLVEGDDVSQFICTVQVGLSNVDNLRARAKSVSEKLDLSNVAECKGLAARLRTVNDSGRAVPQPKYPNVAPEMVRQRLEENAKMLERALFGLLSEADRMPKCDTTE